MWLVSCATKRKSCFLRFSVPLERELTYQTNEKPWHLHFISDTTTSLSDPNSLPSVHTYIHKQHSLRIHCTYTNMQVGLYDYYSRLGPGTGFFLFFFNISRISRQSGYGEADPGSRSYSTFLSNLSVGSKLEVFHHHDSTCCFTHTCTQQNICGKDESKILLLCRWAWWQFYKLCVSLVFFFSSALNKHVPILLYCVLTGYHDVVNTCYIYMCVYYYRIHR